MADVVAENNPDEGRRRDGNINDEGETDEERQRREQAEAIERMLLAQEQAEETDALLLPHEDHGHDHDHDRGMPQDFQEGRNDANGFDGAMLQQERFFNNAEQPASPPLTRRISYVQASMGAAIGLVFYALRTRQQLYLAVVFMSSSKMAYVILGNALVAMAVTIFKISTRLSLGGLRLAEAEGLGDFFRWNITETCLALTMFRSELDVPMAIQFLVLVVAKCIHWVADLRERHIRLTHDAISITRLPIVNIDIPGISFDSLKLVSLLVALQSLDLYFVVQCGQSIISNGPSVSLFFSFEAAILVVSASSSILMWNLHVMDGLIVYYHEQTAERAEETPTQPTEQDINVAEDNDGDAAVEQQPTSHRHSWKHTFVHRYIYPVWKDHKATLEFAVEVQAQAARFLLYLTFFSLVLTYYGLPINLIREVYLSWQALRQRLIAFSKYRSLLASMNKFDAPSEEDDITEPCIICRDELHVTTSKKLPGCGHIFHTSCLREWLVQQPTCPTCRSDIEANQARERRARRDAAAAAAEQEGDVQEEERRRFEGMQFMEGLDRAPDQAASGNESKENEAEDTPDKTKPDKSGVFPALYRVSNEAGAEVWASGENGILSIVRTVPSGKVVLGQALQWRRHPDADGVPSNRMMLRMPDGWVLEEDVTRIVSVSPTKRSS